MSSERTVSLDGQRPTRTPEWVSIHEAALLMGVSPATLRRWSDAGDIRTFTTPGGHRRFSRTVIAGLMPTIATTRPTQDDLLVEMRDRMVRFVDRAARRAARAAPWTDLDEEAVSIVRLQARRVVDGLLGILDAHRAGERARALASARSAAAACGELAGRRGIGLSATVETWLQLRAMIVHELTGATRRHDLEVASSTRQIELASRCLDALLIEVMRGHEAAASPVPEVVSGRGSTAGT